MERMWRMPEIIAHVGSLASFIGSLTVVGGALMWIYNKFISAPREKRRQREADKRQRDRIELITEKNKPLNESIQGLNELLAESQSDREKLNQIAKVNTDMIKNHEDRIDNHNERLIVLETKNGIQKIAYREGSEEE
jgi:hypothetical protein